MHKLAFPAPTSPALGSAAEPAAVHLQVVADADDDTWALFGKRQQRPKLVYKRQWGHCVLPRYTSSILGLCYVRNTSEYGKTTQTC